jgi:hypothetical protein
LIRNCNSKIEFLEPLILALILFVKNQAFGVAGNILGAKSLSKNINLKFDIVFGTIDMYFSLTSKQMSHIPRPCCGTASKTLS